MTAATIHCHREGTRLNFTLTGAWRRDDSPPRFSSASDRPARGDHLFIDATSVESWDSSLVSLVLQAQRQGEAVGFNVSWQLPSGADRLLQLALAVPPSRASSGDKPDSLTAWLVTLALALNPVHVSERIGREMMRSAEFIGALLVAGLAAMTGQARTRTVDAMRFGFQSGPNALPIISLTSFLVGMILGYLGAVQLQQFGAGIYVANLVTVGILREMGALMTAIILAGRTGAAYAAQLGTMRVNEEVDAIEILGVSIIEFLVLPRVVAVIIMMPLLTLYADVLGILGGGIVASGLGISPLQYWTQVQGSVGLDHLLVGLVKSVVFGALVGIAGCRAGLDAARNSEGVGKATTTAVVVALIYLIVADALINVFCQLMEI